eukprot:TRINITY_DN9681_c0_g1_i2.p1 TRINITY_DN9681_c0_g1~~TRINITY_DN9681_c0_g1_i2.p1  ORF type:complete len:225 (-),score=38.26 TRINITY_DN9681_c0_g1_i2:124-798(-)
MFRHSLMFVNKRVRVSNFELPASFQCTSEIHHLYPTIRWCVGDGTFVTTTLGSGTSVVETKHKQVFFVEPGTLWTAFTNKSDLIFRQIVFEILEQTPKYSEETVKKLRDMTVFSPDVGTKLLFENKWCRCWDFSLETNESVPVHQHTLDYCFTMVGRETQHRLLGYNPDGSLQFDSISNDGDVVYQEIKNGGFEDDGVSVLPEARHAGKNGLSSEFCEYLVELK